MENTDDINNKKFTVEAVKTGKVWGLLVDDNWAVSPSTDFENAEVLLFWSNEGDAKKCATEDWNDYQPQSIILTEFIEEWLPGMYEEGIVVGTNWTPSLEGLESDPLSLAIEIVNELIEQKSNYIPEGYNSLSEFEAALIEMGDDL